jgi:hypothetical protein
MSVEAIAVLRSIDASLKRLVAIAEKRQGGSATAGAVAPDRDLDSKYGNPVVRLSPRDWTGEPCKGLKFSECPADFLDMLAETLEYFAGKSEREGATTTNGKPKADFERKDAARARGWAQRVRSGKVTPPVTNGHTGDEWGADGF